MAEVGDISDKSIEAFCFEWKIPNYFLAAAVSGSIKNFSTSFDSPIFDFSNCTWQLQHGSSEDGWISMYLSREPIEEVAKSVAFTLGLKKCDGTEETKELSYHTFQIDDLVKGWSNFWSKDELLARKSELLTSGAIIFTCRIVDNMPRPVKEVSQSRKFIEYKKLSSDFKDLFLSKRYCDFTFKVRDKVFSAHRAVLMARSTIFAAMFENDSSDSKEEKESDTFQDQDCDPECFEDFLRYLYTGSIDCISFKTAYHLYCASIKYGAKELKDYCISYMIRNLNAENVCDVIELAEEFDDFELKSLSQAFFNRNFYRISSTTNWKKLMKVDHLLAFSLLEEMTSEMNHGQRSRMNPQIKDYSF